MTQNGLGNYVRDRRRAMKLTQRDLAIAIKANDRSYVTQIEAGRILMPSTEMRRRLAAVLRVREVDLLIAAGELDASQLDLASTCPLPEKIIGIAKRMDTLSDAHLNVMETLLGELVALQGRSSGSGTRS